jgi:hypothetical protein
MDITVGGAGRPEGATAGSFSPGGSGGGGEVHGWVLAVRPASAREREKLVDARGREPAQAMTVTLVVPDGARLPADLATGDYRLVVRVARDPRPRAATPAPAPAADALEKWG